ncbi:MAG: hypothetical protein H6976_03520 [Gammaproteobacteria bacterium]|nr:hypothetical protein [Gammaproteobacteria bacterium]
MGNSLMAESAAAIYDSHALLVANVPAGRRVSWCFLDEPFTDEPIGWAIAQVILNFLKPLMAS